MKQDFLDNRFANMFNEAQVSAQYDTETGTYTIEEKRESELASPSIMQLKNLDAAMVEEEDEEEEPGSPTSEEIPTPPRRTKSKKVTPQKRETYEDCAMMDEEVVERPDLDMEHGGGGKGNGDYFWRKALHDEFMRHFTVWGKTWKIVSQKMIENGISDKDQLQCRTHGQKYLLSLADIHKNLTKKDFAGKQLDKKIFQRIQRYEDDKRYLFNQFLKDDESGA